MGCTSSVPAAQDSRTDIATKDNHNTLLTQNPRGPRKPRSPAGQKPVLSLEERAIIANRQVGAASSSISDLLGAIDDPSSFWIGSQTDAELANVESFAPKTVAGNKTDAQPVNFGFACKKGLKPTKANQDSWFMIQVDACCAIYAVVDGHGRHGEDVSQFVRQHLPELILRDPRLQGEDAAELVREVFEKMQALISIATQKNRLKADRSGATATLIVHDKVKRKLLVSHVGDSAACIVRKGDPSEFAPVVLTRDHQPGLAEERERIEIAGGRVQFDGIDGYRVYAGNEGYPGINMSRSLGDLLGHSQAGLSAKPDIREYTIASDDRLLLICSDGVWTWMSHEAVARAVEKFSPQDASAAAEGLAKAAWDSWIRKAEEEQVEPVVDDITVLCVFLGDE